MPKLYNPEDEDSDIVFIPGPIKSVTCKGREVLWNSSSNSTVFVRKIISKGIWRIDVVFLGGTSNPDCAFGLATENWQKNGNECFLGNDSESFDYNSSGDCYHQQSYKGNIPWTAQDIVSFELNMNKRVVCIFLNDVLQPVGFSQLPPRVKIGVCIKSRLQGVRLLKFRQVSQHSATVLQADKPLSFQVWGKDTKETMNGGNFTEK